MFVSEAVHRIVATAFHGEAPTNNHVVDHIDTNRQNNRPENLRWLTRIENLLLNPITLNRILYKYGSIDNFFADPSKPLDGDLSKDFSWMRTVTKEESENTKENLLRMGKEGVIRRGGALGEWLFSKISMKDGDTTEEGAIIESLTKNALQKEWKTPSEFPFCPSMAGDTALEEYCRKLVLGELFAKDKYKESKVVNAKVSEESGELFVICSHPNGIKGWSLAKVYIDEVGKFVHESLGTFFDLEGAQKEFSNALRLEWEGGETFDELVR